MSGPGTRQQLTRRVRAALWAIEHDDAAGWRVQVDALIEWRNQPLLQGLVRLAGELGDALGEAQAGQDTNLHDACARLEHVVRISEEATHRALDRIEDCRGLLAVLEAAPGTPGSAAIAGIQSHLSEMTAAQGYQDLNAQVILRVVELVRCVQAGIGGAQPPGRPLHLRDARPHGNGPAVAGVDAAPVTQDDANQLLSSLGL